MDLTLYVNHLGRKLAALAETAGEREQSLIERMSGPIGTAIRMTLLDALSAAAAEITREMAPGSVELRLRAHDSQFVVTAPPAEPHSSSTVAPSPSTKRALAEDGPATRINVRMPEGLKTAITEAAATEGCSVNAWLVRAVIAGLHQPADDASAAPRGAGIRES